MEKLVAFFEIKIQTPEAWGPYHLCCMGLLAAGIALLAVFAPKLRSRPNLVLGLTAGAGTILLFTEILKQVFYGLHIGENGIYWDYPWWIFPFQMCSTPMYVSLLVPAFGEGRMRRALCNYLGTYGMLGGVVVMLFPGSVFTDLLFIDLHTMLWHILLVCLGVLQWAGGTAGNRFSDFLRSAAVFLCLAAIAAALNCLFPQLAQEGFNMFYLSPYIPASMSEFARLLWESVPYPVYVLLYVLGFSCAAAAVFLLAAGMRNAADRNANKSVRHSRC